MVDKRSDDLLAKLRRLSKRELEVLDLRCQGMKYSDIGKALFISVPTVKTDMGRVYMKLGLDLLEPSQRLKVLYDTVGPQLQLIKSEIGKAKTGSTKKKPEPEVVDGEVVGESEGPIPPKVKKMVEEDGVAIVPWKPAPLVAPQRPNPPRSIWPAVLVVGVVLGICLGAGIVYLLLRSSGGLFGGAPQVLPVVIPTSVPQIATSIPSQSPADTPTTTMAPTDTSVPTFTQEATAVPPPTIPALVPPSNGILFEDNFDNGLNPEWTNYGNDWLVADGKLTLSTSAAFNEKYEWIELQHPEWRNYTVSLDVNPQTGQLSPFGYEAIVVRKGSGSGDIGVVIDDFPYIYWANIGSNGLGSTAISGRNTGSYFQSGSSVEITVQGNNYVLKVDGQDIQKISMGGHDSGGVALGIECRFSLKCPTFDNLKVMYLP